VSGSSLALEVPSVLATDEKNILLNPSHPDFSKVTIGAPVAFFFDPRLLDPSLRK